jgi:hypothetical protein
VFITFARRSLVGGTFLVLLMSGAACSDESKTDGQPTRDPSPTRSPTSSPTATDTGSGSPTTGPTSTSPTSPTVTADPSMVADLLSAERMPGLNSETVWTESAVYPDEGPGFSTLCQQHPWTSIGSTAVVRRDYTGLSGANATAIVADFATGKNARRAQAVWDAWSQDCKATVIARGFEHPHISNEPYIVSTEAAPGRWWLLTYGPVEGDSQASYFEAFGLVRSGDRLALIRMTSVGQDYSYPAGQEPVAIALRRAAGLLTS